MLRKMFLFIVMMLHSICFAFDPSFNGDDNYYHCAQHGLVEWYIIMDSIELDFDDEDMPIITVDILQTVKNQPDKELSYRFLYDENENKMYILYEDNDREYIPPVRSYALVGNRLSTGQYAHRLVFGDSFYHSYWKTIPSSLIHKGE